MTSEDEICKNRFSSYKVVTTSCGLVAVYNVRQIIALFTDNILHLHYNETEHECEAISGKDDKIARNCLASPLRCIVMQMSQG